MLHELAARLDEAIVATTRVTVATAAAIFDPDVVVTVGAGGDPSAVIYARLFAQSHPSAGFSTADERAVAIYRALATQSHPSAGMSAADRAVAEIYRSLATFRSYTPPPARGFGGA